MGITPQKSINIMSNTEKKFDKFFVANLKRTAQMVSPMVREKVKLLADIEEKQNRVATLNAQIESLDSHIRQECGYGVEQLITRKVVDTGKVDKDGKPVKVTKWELNFPETIVPPQEQPADEVAEETIQGPEIPIE